MKKLLPIYLYAHAVQMALGALGLIAVALLSPGYGISPLWALFVLPMGYAAHFLGSRCKRAIKSDDAWNCAIVLYALSLAAYFLRWKFGDSLAVRALNLWNLPSAPVLAGLDAWVGHFHTESAFDYDLFYRSARYKELVLPVMGALAAAISPVSFTLGLLRHNKEN
ncbi:MAG: hypothetical protein IIX99_00585 [Oscillospiraceae bacterium]|nr:hypothetical protein [Oscillospiraceae bacterium]